MEKQSHFVIDSPTAILVDEIINECDKSQRQISVEIGLSPNSNALTVFKRGRSPMPIGRIAKLCDVCGAGPNKTKLLLETAIQEYFPDISASLPLLTKTNFSKGELRLISAIRAGADERDLKTDNRSMKLLKEFVAKFLVK